MSSHSSAWRAGCLTAGPELLEGKEPTRPAVFLNGFPSRFVSKLCDDEVKFLEIEADFGPDSSRLPELTKVERQDVGWLSILKNKAMATGHSVVVKRGCQAWLSSLGFVVVICRSQARTGNSGNYHLPL